MMRLTGFLAGVSLTVAALVLTLNALVNRQREPVATPDTTAQHSVAMVEAAAEPVDGVAAAHEPDSEELADVAQPDAGSVEAVAPDDATATTDKEPQPPFEASAADASGFPDVQTQAQPVGDEGEADIQVRAHLFWSPFRSEWAARGFAKRLTASTQVPVEVINMGPANYRVAFNYQDESERLARIERIETVTGLQLE